MEALKRPPHQIRQHRVYVRALLEDFAATRSQPVTRARTLVPVKSRTVQPRRERSDEHRSYSNWMHESGWCARRTSD